MPHPNDIKENWITGSEYLPSIILNNIDECAELNSAKKALMEGRKLLFSGQVKSVKFNSITSSLKYCFVKGVVMPQIRVNENLYSVWVCIYNDGSILTGDSGCVADLISSWKLFFAILYYIENEVTLGHDKTCTSKKKKCDVCIYRKSKKLHPPIKIENVSFVQPYPEYEYDKISSCLSRKRSRFDPQSAHDYDASFCQKDWEELAKGTNGTASVFQFIPTTTSMTSCLSTVWDGFFFVEVWFHYQL